MTPTHHHDSSRHHLCKSHGKADQICKFRQRRAEQHRTRLQRRQTAWRGDVLPGYMRLYVLPDARSQCCKKNETTFVGARKGWHLHTRSNREHSVYLNEHTRSHIRACVSDRVLSIDLTKLSVLLYRMPKKRISQRYQISVIVV